MCVFVLLILTTNIDILYLHFTVLKHILGRIVIAICDALKNHM